VTHKLFALKKFLHRKAGVKIPIFPVICFPAKTPTFVDLPYTEALTPLQIHVMKRTCLGSYFEYKEKRFHPSHSISETYTKVVAELLVSYLDN